MHKSAFFAAIVGLLAISLCGVPANAQDLSGGTAVGILIKDLAEFILGFGGELHVFRRYGPGNPLHHICGGQIHAGIGILGIQVDGFLEEAHGVGVLRVLVRRHAFIQVVARLQLIAPSAQ